MKVIRRHARWLPRRRNKILCIYYRYRGSRGFYKEGKTRKGVTEMLIKRCRITDSTKYYWLFLLFGGLGFAISGYTCSDLSTESTFGVKIVRLLTKKLICGRKETWVMQIDYKRVGNCCRLPVLLLLTLTCNESNEFLMISL